MSAGKMRASAAARSSAVSFLFSTSRCSWVAGADPPRSATSPPASASATDTPCTPPPRAAPPPICRGGGADGAGGRGGAPRGRWRGAGGADGGRRGGHPARPHRGGARQYDRGGAVVDRGRVAGGDRAVLLERGAQPGQLV